jgi:hypothetical protein
MNSFSKMSGFVTMGGHKSVFETLAEDEEKA